MVKDMIEVILVFQGAYGTVYLATHKPTGKQYALKRMDMNITDVSVEVLFEN